MTQTIPTGNRDDEIQIYDLHKSFGQIEVLKGISTIVRRGEVVCVIGPSGSGKSTLLRCVNLLEQPTQGRIFILNDEITDLDADVDEIRTKMGMVFQQFNLFPHLTAMQNCTIAPIRVLKKDKAVAEGNAQANLDKVGLGDRGDAYPAQLSGGQQQRVAVARGLAARPSILLADEPTSDLDATTREIIVGLLRAEAEAGAAVLMSTHDSWCADQSDVEYHLDDGHVERRR